MNLPALCTELRLHQIGGVPVVNSRDVAELFEKEHKHVLRDIDGILTGPDLGPSWFCPAEYIDAKGESRRSFDLTRQGFTLLVMGWTGERAMTFKVRYIEAFDVMEAALRAPATISPDQFIQAVREIVAPLAIRFDGQDRAIERVESRVDGIAQDVASLKKHLFSGRKALKEAVKREHVDALFQLGARCPCCSRAEVISNNSRSPFADFDHFYQNSHANAEHTWLICKPCHQDLTSGRVPRDQREAEFRAYQQQRRRLPGRQVTLFG